MRNPFEIGARYRNRKGEYEVVELDEPRMIIRYDDGETIETRVKLQARILTNMAAERAARKRQAIRRAARKSRKSGGRIRFSGLTDGDFQNGTAGTNWRARTGLGGLLRERLSVRTNRRFESFPIPRQPMVHIAQPEHYEKKSSLQQAKFVMLLDPDCARYGLYIEKNDGPMGKVWHWPNLMAALAGDKALQKETLAAMRRLELHWEVYTHHGDDPGTWITAGKDGLQWQVEGGEAEAVSWSEFLERLVAVDEDTWCDLYLWTSLDKNQAMAAGADIADKAIEVYGELLPLYDAAVGVQS